MWISFPSCGSTADKSTSTVPYFSGRFASGVFYESREISTPSKSEDDSYVLDSQVAIGGEQCQGCLKQLRFLEFAKSYSPGFPYGFFDDMPILAKDPREILKRTARIGR